MQDLGQRATFHCCGSSGFRTICNRAEESESFIAKGFLKRAG